MSAMNAFEQLGFLKRHVVNGQYQWVVEVNFIFANTYGQQIIRWAFERQQDAINAVWDGDTGAVAKAISIVQAHRETVLDTYCIQDEDGKDCIEIGVVIRPMGLEEAKRFQRVEATYGVGTSNSDASTAMSASMARRAAINRNIVYKPFQTVVLYEERLLLIMGESISVRPLTQGAY